MLSIEPKILTVTQLNRQVHDWLETHIGSVWVSGEVSNLARPSSGHYYFSLKDAGAQIRCAYFKQRQTKDTGILENGLQIIVEGQLSLYEPRGDYQLIIAHCRPAGKGELWKQFELLKAKLHALGLFAPERKKPIPAMPRCIGIITSPTGAARHDMETTIARRFPIAKIILYPSDVQGTKASQQIINALQYANHEARCDVLILARGGGSMEDLWAFNHEALAYTIAESRLPIVTGIGHDVDFTIADFVADCRAPTPTAAAELVTPDSVKLLQFLRAQEQRLCHDMKKRLIFYWQKLDHLTHRLQAQNRKQTLLNNKEKLSLLQKKLKQSMAYLLNQKNQNFLALTATLNAVSPLATLARGYAIASLDENILTDSHQANVGDSINIRLAQGILICEIKGHHHAG